MQYGHLRRSDRLPSQLSADILEPGDEVQDHQIERVAMAFGYLRMVRGYWLAEWGKRLRVAAVMRMIVEFTKG